MANDNFIVFNKNKIFDVSTGKKISSEEYYLIQRQTILGTENVEVVDNIITPTKLKKNNIILT